MDYVWDICHSIGLTSKPPSSAIFPEYYRDIHKDYHIIVSNNSDNNNHVGNTITPHILGVGTWGTVRRVQLKKKVHNDGDDNNNNNNNHTHQQSHHQPQQYYACKTILKSKLPSDTAQELLKREVYNLNCCQSAPHIIQFVDIYEDYYAVHIIMEECTGGDLHQLIVNKETNGIQDEVTTIHIIYQILIALYYIHDSCGVCHRDLKASNFLFKYPIWEKSNNKETNNISVPDIRIIDFGLSKHVVNKMNDNHPNNVQQQTKHDMINNNESLSTPIVNDETSKSNNRFKVGSAIAIEVNENDDEGDKFIKEKNRYGYMTSEVGTPYYVAPEIVCNDKCDCKCDIYSVGVNMYLCYTGKLPIRGKDERETIRMLMNPNYQIDFSDKVWYETTSNINTSNMKDDKKEAEPSSEASPNILKPTAAQKFCKALLERDPMDRPTALQALQMEWMTNHFGTPPGLFTLVTGESNNNKQLPSLSKNR